MLDKLCKKILKVLTDYSGENSYSIIDISEILNTFANKLDIEVLRKYIDYLANNEYIDVKYIDEKQVCLAIMPKAKGLEEEAKEEKKFNKKFFRMAFFMSLASAICGFVGAFLGNVFFG